MKAKIFLLILLVSLAFSQSAEENVSLPSSTDANKTMADHRARIARLTFQLEAIDKELNEESVWQKIYANHLTFTGIAAKINEIEKKIERYRKKGTRRYRTKIMELESKKAQLQEQLDLLKDYEHNPFKTLIKPKEIKKIPTVTNPIAIINAFSYIKQLNEHLMRFEHEIDMLKAFTDMLERKIAILRELSELEPNDKTLYRQLDQTTRELEDAREALDLHQTALIVYKKKVDEIKLRLTDQIKEQAKKAGSIGISIFVILLFVILFKWLVKRTITDNERFYMANKIINFSFVFIVIMILLFAYIENVSYLVTVLGFASAGIAIAMKDWFMSMLGWLVIVLGGSIHVGDRIRVDKDGMKYVGDVLDISLLRITILEDITLTTYLHNRRAGRIIFVPNNYIFTDMIANYSHATLKTVWDGIDFTITFNSNHKKAQHIAKETAKKYAKGYTDITRKQLNKLRSRYSLKNTNVEPRVYSFIEENGIRISVWYLTNAYATLTLRSTISTEILDLIKEEEDIIIAYPSQHIYIDQAKGKPTLPDLSEGSITI
ncbi:mechanosensitive ion channel domain-containing protein [Hydrogenimonas cancrithermarum]|uniref:Membrane protein n=1 Tax=Hydrogenimonas cancrithermarum TaxID=2993563 RepID=A0ABN6WSV6_9BACT|nr:mechanosensitive ion channel domain-containing protein [Hydrogenimonas cancrithermarum]BDY11948.1 membrane protein [Hydrogenimonas cancrithermarum]